MKNPIGVFDSGFGGLTVLKAIRETLPNQDVIYFGDTAHLPYGSKSKDVIQKFSLDISNFLIKQGVKLIVVACNTASSFALDYLRRKIDIPVIGVIEPAANKAIEISKFLRIGVIGTKGTINSKSYDKAMKNIKKNVKIFSESCPLFVPLVEEGMIDNKITYDIAKMYLSFFKDKNIDSLILGCTHYPALKSVIAKILGKKINILDSAYETALVVKNKLNKMNNVNLYNKAKVKFFVSDDPKKFKTLGKNFLNEKIQSVKKIEL